jgi:putative heme-binding domain-containing protein
VLHLLGQAKGDPTAGKALFQKHCATCHTLFGDGNKIGPDLTSADRQNRGFLVTSMVDPSAIIRPEYMAHTVTTVDGRMLHGIIVERSEGAITLVDNKTDRTVLSQSKIESLEPSPVSLMPESILDPFDDQQIRDLVSYIQSDGAAATRGADATTLTPSTKEPTDKEAKPLKVCLVSGSLEYDSDHSLAGFQEFLEKHYRVKCSRAFRKADNDLPGLENLKTCDVMLLFTRRLTIDGEQLEEVKKYCQAGKPIVAVRTASHAFQNWLALDKEILGGNYQGHYGTGPAVEVHIEKHAKDHPILMNVKAFRSAGSLYKNTGLAKGAEVLLTGSIPEHMEPVAWTHLSHGGRVFYTSLGHSKDFSDDNFKQLVVNALFWTANRPMAKRQ